MEGLLREYQQRIETVLDHWLQPPTTHPASLHQAMRYSAMDGGKRIRPILVYATAKALGVPLSCVDGPACAVELIHVYSLIHDDLPAMDNDDLRRGRPTCHKAFDEATAILAGDAMQALAFQILVTDPEMTEDPKVRLRMMEILARASGSRGMAGGQAIDLASVGQQIDLVQLEDMHIHKTGALIRASVLLGALSLVEIDEVRLEKLDRYAKCIGLAFQIRDDILDVESDTETLGKPQGSDMAQNKPTYPALIGMEASKQRARELVDDALESISPLGPDADLLRFVARYIVERIH
ncbi:(2E,6E)-farnesyl diphosphate synthase [Thiorhodospira sibirica]|uniref:(2E,6E)-farnesyl diphosphate synthase n=1 Tax=Thiorhodospira sibirica TaxID=154347 RepID=UPI00022C0AE8|nr:farnesyl diphosphate synthase [Thiorhodospira sibirica]